VLKIRLSLVGSRVSVHEIDANNLGAPAQVRSAWPQQNSPLIWFIVVFDLRRILLPCFFLGRHIRGRFSDNSACFCFVEWAETIGLNFCKNKWSHNRLTLGIFSYQANIPTKHRYQCPSDEPQAFSYLLFFSPPFYTLSSLQNLFYFISYIANLGSLFQIGGIFHHGSKETQCTCVHRSISPPKLLILTEPLISFVQRYRDHLRICQALHLHLAPTPIAQLCSHSHQ
jgi:hypothetical protein